MRILVLRHVDCEPPAAYLPLLEQHADVTTVRLGVDPLPPRRDFAALIAMGGPMSVNDRAAFGWLAGEIDFIAAAVADGIPYWGVCLGAQLLAAALGAAVYPGPAPEVGVHPVARTAAGAEDPLFGALPDTFETLQWHSDTFDLPAGATLLATSSAYAHQAFRYGSCYGVQFHLETPAELAGEWLGIDAYRQSLHDALGPHGDAILLDALGEAQIRLMGHARTLMGEWLHQFVLGRQRPHAAST
jgi:GMP synthase-like glutamine amidotransferase